MSLARRTSLVRLAREFDALIISDDVYDFLQWPAPPSAALSFPDHAPLPRLTDIDRTLDSGPNRPGADGFGNAVSNGTFSKIVGPGVRCGWNEASPKFAYGVSQCGSSTSGGAPSQLTSTYMAKLIETGGLQKHIREVLQPSYARRWRRLVGEIEKHLEPLGVKIVKGEMDKGENEEAKKDREVEEVAGGYFLWVELPAGVSAVEYAKRCLEVEVPILAGPRFAIPGDQSLTFEKNVRLCFSCIDEDLMGEAVEKIAGVLKKMLAE